MSIRRLLRDARNRGEADAGVDPGALGHTPLGDFGAGGSREAAARRLLHALRVPAGIVGLACYLLPRRYRQRPLAVAERFAYWHGARRAVDRETWRRLTQGTAILMYHAVGGPGEPGSRLVVPANRLERQLRWLARRKRPVLALDALVDYRRSGRLPPAGAVVITLDDGYVDAAEVAAPLLGRFGFPATMFAVSERVGASADWNGAAELSGRPLLDWDGLARLQRSGWTVGAHTRTHPLLPELDPRETSEEIEQSRIELRERLNTPIRSFCYPYGRYGTHALTAVARAGFDSACGIDRGLNYPSTPLFELRRAPVDGDASMLRFMLGVCFGDPYLLAGVLPRLRGAVLGTARRRQARLGGREPTA